MEINAQFDAESSKISEKIIFSCEIFELKRENITDLKKKKLISHIQEDDLPPRIDCQVLIFFENSNKAKVMFFNSNFILPLKVFDEPFLNRDLIDRSKKNWGFWMEFTIPLYDKWIQFTFSYKT